MLEKIILLKLCKFYHIKDGDIYQYKINTTQRQMIIEKVIRDLS